MHIVFDFIEVFEDDGKIGEDGYNIHVELTFAPSRQSVADHLVESASFPHLEIK